MDVIADALSIMAFCGALVALALLGTLVLGGIVWLLEEWRASR